MKITKKTYFKFDVIKKQAKPKVRKKNVAVK